ncbi:hypothetical protein J8F10_22830 [Gemmata sp. G18]|uniref:DUF4178 domain-containing protein n=1 Tax=Gemmata palustris TaxID=2822762 RepID=A0ABS5BWI2_9BACT|nr:hypothetical protein [Gemmata palustris]MBP3958096.1 hypothetical protein [Gemmata palustris]
MVSTHDTNPANWQKTLSAAWSSLALGTAGCGFVLYMGWSEYRDKGTLDSNALTGMGIVSLASLMFLAFGAILLPRARQEGRQQQAVRDATTRDTAVVPDGEQHWTPGAGVTGHGGRPLVPEGDYFVAPPPEIGAPISAYTSLVRGTRPRAAGKVRLASSVLGALGFLLGWLVMSVLEPKDATAAPVGGAVLGLLGSALGLGWARFQHACSYVGTGGVARYICVNNRQHLRESEVFLFRDATALRTALTRHYRNGAYQETEFRFDWVDADGQIRFQTADTYYGSADGQNPWAHMPYQWACAAEIAWTQYRLENLSDELARHGAIRFNLDGSNWLAVGPDVLDVHRGGETVRCAREDIWQFHLSEGTFTVRVLGGQKEWSGPGRAYTFNFDDVADVRLFVIVMDRLLGIELRT